MSWPMSPKRRATSASFASSWSRARSMAVAAMSAATARSAMSCGPNSPSRLLSTSSTPTVVPSQRRMGTASMSRVT